MGSGLSASRCRSMFPAIALPDKRLIDTEEPSHCGITRHPFSLSPHVLADTIASRSVSELEALGGLDSLARGLYSDLCAGIPSSSFPPTSSNEQSSESRDWTPHTVRISVYGTNRIPRRKTKGIFELMWNVLCDKVLILLCIVAAVSLVLGLSQTFQPHLPGQPRMEWVDSVTIMVAVLIVVASSAINDFQREKQFAALLQKTKDGTVKAVRSGKALKLSAYDVLVGDVVHLTPGVLIPADGILITGYSVLCDESSITGESEHLSKRPLGTDIPAPSFPHTVECPDPFIISGSKVLEGTGTYLVTCVGVNSIHGRLEMNITEPTKATPLQAKLSVMADKIAAAGLSVAALLLMILVAKIGIRLWESQAPAVEVVQSFLRIFMVSISIIVVAVPEGLPLAVTLALAIGVSRMLRDNNLVRDLSACETMGNATVVCSDKTGTLTMNKMTVVAGCIGLGNCFGDDSHYHRLPAPPTKQHRQGDDMPVPPRALSSNFCSFLHPRVRHVLVKSIAVNTTALEGEEDGMPTFIGSSTETALLAFGRAWLVMPPLQQERASVRVKHMYPFDSSTSYMATVTELSMETHRIYVKGAPEMLLRQCTRVISSSCEPLGESTVLTGAHRESLFRIVDGYGDASLRTIGLAYKDVSSRPATDACTDDEVMQLIMQGLTFLGVLGMQDPLRPEVCEAVAQCVNAGVSVRMVTGDSMRTAQAIARKCGILDEGGLVMEGAEFRKLSAVEMTKVLPGLQVLARASPEDKKKLVEGFRELSETVAVTGDGTNDGPALRAADVGFSMGISGTDIARQASSIVLTDDNFASIVRAIEWGRTINDAVKKFIHFQLTVNITAVTLTFLSAVSSDTGDSVLSPAQLLWVNLIMDTLAALALATDPPHPGVLNRPPDTKLMPLISATGWKMIFGQAVYQLTVMLLLTLKGQDLLQLLGSDGAPRALETFIFNTFVWIQIFNLHNLSNRRLDNQLNVFEGVHRNLYFIAINVLIIMGQVLIVTLGGTALSTVPLSGSEWAVSIALGALCMPVAVMLRLISDDAISSGRLGSTRPKTAATSFCELDDEIAPRFLTAGRWQRCRARRLLQTVIPLFAGNTAAHDTEAAAHGGETAPLLASRQDENSGRSTGNG